ncbi:MAG TPA: formate dehydrogenase subunit gamma [Paenalcaligenes hominis]|uniref:Formate dehydrogenase subunit gamma n=1 Tax=Paenalcaligenes hominis TaxID=643674 RepID=A0A1U9K2U5_9BURK|nr:formate dehydrogenase subunit gamma [Paenalcaligenes hominis]AQS52259.1 formate dehydrogenase subunit gamma [Paenalcaligenes hominis]NJB65857.1 formate dehydrogenase subunit gamma [Paenalcaligenes hominis]HJH24037.1 formate dehydrogenase subunit gamma [Paenalcaligenes hominis]
MSDKKYPIVRYTAGERINHWITAITFILLTASGLALFHPAFFWLSNLLGSPTWTRILHPFIGVVMFLSFFILAFRLMRFNRFTKKDSEWLSAMPKVLRNETEGVPTTGRYNAGQKLLFYVLIILMLGLLASGIVIWREYFSYLFGIDMIRLASVVHALFAFLLICAIIVHIYAAIWVKGSVRAMTRGTVSRGWAWKNHRDWFREEIRKQDVK